jgi:hypothetical protein
MIRIKRTLKGIMPSACEITSLVGPNPRIVWNITNCSMKKVISTCVGSAVYNSSADVVVRCYTQVRLTLVLSLFLKSRPRFTLIYCSATACRSYNHSPEAFRATN